jgi:hypothetical protein
VKIGRFAGGGVPYGYMSAPNPAGPGRILVKDPDRIGWLEEAVGKAMRGETVNAITSWLTAQGAPLPANRSRRDPADKAWNRQTVDGLLRNPVLAGMRPHNPGRGKSGSSADPFAVARDDAGNPVVDEALSVIGQDEFAELQRLLDSRTSPQARKRSEREPTSAFLSKVARCDDCGVYMCRGANQKRPVVYCPKCRQTIGRERLDPYLVRRLLAERGSEPLGGLTVRDRWAMCGPDEDARRAVLLAQLSSLRIRRGVVGRAFDKKRVVLAWKPAADMEGATL